MLRNSKISISNPKLASHIRSTKSAHLAMSIIELISLLHSIRVIRRFFDTTIEIGPLISVTFVRVKFLMRLLIKVDLPTFGGPTIPMTIGGGSSGVMSINGTWCFLVFKSCLRRNLFSALRADVMAKPFGFLGLSVGSSFDFLNSFFCAFTPK